MLGSLAGCGGPPPYDPGLTPAQNELKQASARFDTTTGASCAVGAKAGAALGAVNSITTGTSPPPPSTNGGAVGAKIGCGAGYLVARSRHSGRNDTLVSNDEALNAQQDVAAYRRAAAAATQIALDAHDQFSGSPDPRQARNYRDSAILMTRQILGMLREIEALRLDAGAQAPRKSAAMVQSAAQIDAARGQMQSGLTDLNSNLVPAGPGS